MLRDSHAGNVRLVSVNGTGHGLASRKSTRKAKKVKAPKEKEQLYKLGPVGEMSALTARAASRLRKWAAKAKSYGFPPDLVIHELLEQAAVELEATVIALKRVPKDWKPARGSIGGTPIAEGSTVIVKERHRSARIELTDPRVKLSVTRVVGGKMVCRVEEGAETGMVVVIPRAHLELADED
jgi:hypothetical protein